MIWLERLREAAAAGEGVDLALELADDEADTPESNNGSSARQLPAEDIRAVLLEPILVVDPRGLRIRGASVCGTLDLDHCPGPTQLFGYGAVAVVSPVISGCVSG